MWWARRARAVFRTHLKNALTRHTLAGSVQGCVTDRIKIACSSASGELRF